MKRKVISALLCATMVATMVGGCGSTNKKETEKATEKVTEAATTEAATTEAATEAATTEAATTEAATTEAPTEEETTEAATETEEATTEAATETEEATTEAVESEEESLAKETEIVTETETVAEATEEETTEAVTETEEETTEAATETEEETTEAATETEEETTEAATETEEETTEAETETEEETTEAETETEEETTEAATETEEETTEAETETEEETTEAETETEEETTEAATETEEETTEAVSGTIDLSKVEAKDAYHFEIVSKGFQHQYWQAVLKGAQEEADRLGVTINFVGPNSESDIADQVQMLNSAINAKPAAIGLAALSTDACNDAISQAKTAGIPIVGFDSGVPGAPEGAVVANAATDNYAAGELAAEKSYEALKDRIAAAEGSVRIGVMGQDATSESIVNRGLGFIDKIAELAEADGYTVTVEGNDKYVQDSKVEPTDDAKVIIEVAVPSQVTAELSATDCQTLLNKEDIICIYGSNQHSGEAMVTGNENLQKFGTGEDQVLGVTFDSGTVIKEAVKNGTFYGAITQAPVAMGAAVVDLLTMAANGEEVADVDTGCQWYTAENIEDPEIAQNLYD